MMSISDDSSQTSTAPIGRLTRRTVLRYSFLSAAAMSIVAACQSAATPAPTAAVQAGDAPDILIHTLGSAQLHFLDIIDEVDSLEKDLEKVHGKLNAASTRENLIDGKWWAIPHFIRAGGFWVRQSALKAAGIDPYNDLGDLGKLRDAALKITKDQDFTGWGMTANRSGDGDTMIRNAIFIIGG